ncbi:MAG: Rieske 2Fe-2S domain-containing protein [Hormoscilla sp.]
MTVTKSRPEVIPPTATAPIGETEQEFDWRECWYPVTFVQDLPTDRPYSFSLYDEPLVLFSNQDGKLECLTDRCPHRAAKLSDGQIIDGKIECLYHGWQFGAEGECLHIPQLADDAKIPAKACVKSFKVVEKQGIVWIWAGEAETADEELIATLADWDKPGFAGSDRVSELPYDQSYFIENVLDPAHLNISHDGSQGKRENAQPLEMKVFDSSLAGFQGRFRETRQANQPWRNMDFVAPNLVLLTFSIERKGWRFGLAFYSMPLGKGSCRVLTRSYRNFFTWKIKLTPRWLIHLGQSRILEEDMQLVVGQQEQIEKLGRELKSLYLPLNSSDAFVLEYRKWLDKYGYNLPFYQGYATSKLPENKVKCDRPPVSMARFEQHTQFCSSCSGAYRTAIRVKQSLVGVAIALTAVAIITEGRASIVAVSSAILAVILAAVAQKVKTKFERSYSRH